MKRTLIIIGRIIVVIITILLVLSITVQSPKVQTLITNRIVQKFDNAIDGDISFDRIHIIPFNILSINNLVITDKFPYPSVDPERRQDTLFSAEKLTAIFSLKGLLKGSELDFSYVKVSNGIFILTPEPGRNSNLKRIFRLPEPKNRPDNGKDIFTIKRIVLDGMSFKLVNNVYFSQSTSGSINWSDLYISNIKARGHNMHLKGRVMSAVADHIEFNEASGYRVDHISGTTSVGNGQLLIDDLHITDQYSDIAIPRLRFTYDNKYAWRDFVNKVKMDVDIHESQLSLQSLAYYAPALQTMNADFIVDGKITGPVNNLNIKSLGFTCTGSPISGVIDGNITGLVNPKNRKNPQDRAKANPVFNLTANNTSFTTKDLAAFLEGLGIILPIANYAQNQTFLLDGGLNGYISSPNIKAKLTDAGGGEADLDIHLRSAGNDTSTISGKICTKNFGIGRILNNGTFGELSGATKFEAQLPKSGVPSVKVDSLFINKIGILGYDYSGIAANGTYKDDAFNGRFVCSDPNLNFVFQGIVTPSTKKENAYYQFFANIAYADLHALKLDSRQPSRLSLLTSANFRKLGKDVIGSIDLQNLRLEDASGAHDIGNISIASHINDDDNVNRIKLDSKFAKASYVGTGFVTDFINDLNNLIIQDEIPALIPKDKMKSNAKYSGNSYNLSLKLGNTSEVFSFFAPGLYAADSTSLSLGIDKDGSFSLKSKSDRLAIRNRYLKKFNLNIDNKDNTLTGELLADEISYPPLLMRKASLLSMIDDNHIGIGYAFDNETELSNKGEVTIIGSLSRNNEDNLAINGELLPSAIYFKGDTWKIARTNFGINDKGAKIDSLLISCNEQSISAFGGYSNDNMDTLILNLNKFDIGILNSFTDKDLSIKGLATGKAIITSPSTSKGILANLLIDEGEIAKEKIGILRLASIWDEEKEEFEFKGLNQLDGAKNLDIAGSISPSTNTINAAVSLHSLNLGYFKPFLTGLCSEFKGSFSGDLNLYGPLSSPIIESNNSVIEDSDITLAYTKVPYKVSGPVTIDDKGVSFNSLLLTDRYGETGLIGGALRWDRLQDMFLDTEIGFDNVEVLNTTKEDNESFYGNVFATGYLSLKGPLNALELAVNASSQKSGSFHIPTNNVAKAQSNLLTFKEPDKIIVIDPYEEMMAKLAKSESSKGNLSVKLNVSVHQGVESFLEIDKETGNVLTGRGTGDIQVEVNPQKDLFRLGGGYILNEGNYHFEQLGIVKKNFAIQNGSAIRFNGDISESDLDINANYRLKCQVGSLIADTSSTTRRNVDCGIAITGKLKDPAINLSIKIPDLDPMTQTRVDNALSTEDKIQKQFIALLVSNSFIPDERSGIINNTNMINSTMTEIMANQLSNILQKLDIPLDLGLDYQTGTGGTNIFDLAVSTELFDNRVIINGAIGNRQYSNAQEDEVVGDLDIEVKLDNTGFLRLNLFSHSSDQYTNYLDNSQRNGIGITYQREFSSLKEFFKNLFLSREKKREAEIHLQRELQNQERKTIRIKRNEQR